MSETNSVRELWGLAWEGRRIQVQTVAVWSHQKRLRPRGFLGSPVVKTLPFNARDNGSIPGQGTKIPQATRQLSLHATATEMAFHSQRETHIPQLRLDTAKNKQIKNFLKVSHL